ncbi:SH3 domain-containing protein [Escherichia coli]|uniref:SH3 domain-containing protein n=1 Tax=Escherichia coli TaxID=562 RepID=UPI0021012DB8|nr:SH3 domain-containing protein [Escherichia coli]MCQ1713507.1 SH3 domain-containing protein [Escherichia coli]HDD8711727.1 SH3 domain-containing protein [Escherichia coli]
MMKEKKTSLTNNENEFDITVFPSIVEKSKYQDSLLASSTDASKALEALTKNSGVDALLKNHDSLFAGTTAASKAFEAMTRNSVANTFLKNHDSLLAGSTAASKAFEAMTRNSVVNTFLKNHDSLFASSTAASKAFEAMTRNSGVATLFAKQRESFTRDYFTTSITQHLDKLNPTEIQKLQEAAIIFSRSPQGAAVIATNINTVEITEPDALTKLKKYIEESPVTSHFRKLPLLVQLIIIYLVMTMSSVISDKNKELAIYLIEESQQYFSKAVSPNAHVKKLTKQLPNEIDVSTLKHIRIITGENVRLRNRPSMHGDVLVTLQKYTPVIVIDKSDRKWLYIQLSLGEQKIYGWVNRSYTKALNH